jgi:hypothetical protein
LKLTQVQKLEEIRDWSLFDLPIVEMEDMQNPMYLKHMRDQHYRYYGIDGKYRHPHLYKEKPRTHYVENDRIKNMKPLMNGPITWTGFQDPYDSRRFMKPTDAYKRSESTSDDYSRRMTNIFPDIANVYTDPVSDPSGVISQIDLMLSLR